MNYLKYISHDYFFFLFLTFVKVNFLFSKGNFSRLKKNAKKSSAFIACVKLYYAGALDENLLPTSVKCKPVYSDVNWFPHWVELDNEVNDCKPGTNKMKRVVPIHVCC